MLRVDTLARMPRRRGDGGGDEFAHRDLDR
jgi:hypothetical protein